MKKKNRYHSRAVVMLLLASGAWSQIANSQSHFSNTANQARPNHVSLGRMWANVAKWKWQLSKGKEKVPAFDSTSVEQFRISMQSADPDKNPAGINKLYNDVLDKLDRKGYGGVKNDAFIEALEAVLRNKATIRGQDIDIIISKLTLLNTGAEATKLGSKTGLASEPTSLTPATKELDEARAQLILTKDELEQVKAANSRLFLHRNLMAFAAGLLALGLMGSILWKFRRGSKSTLQQDTHVPSLAKNTSSQTQDSISKLSELKNQLLIERENHRKLLDKFDELNARYKRLEANSALESPKQLSIASSTASTSSIIVTAQPNTPPHSVQFADKPENRYLTRLYPDSEAYRPLLIRFSTDPSVTEASFEFNPAADQFFFTHNGVDQLTGTFTYSPPDWLKNPQTIRTLVRGRLRRDGTGWLVDEPAQIEIF